LCDTFNFLFSWDNLYQTELKNFNEFGDEGTIWFGRISETTILRFINAEVDRAVRILDIGCGNGSLLRKLASSVKRILFEFSIKMGSQILPESIIPKMQLNLQNGAVKQIK
jgi:SAM-dependent methyltransferase